MGNKKYKIKADEVEIFPEFKDENRKSVWNIVWTAFTRGDSPVKVGTVSFAGEPVRGRLDIVVEPEPEFKDSKEMKTMLKAMVDWTFNQKNAYEIKADAMHEDDSRIFLLQAAGFVFRTGTREIEHYSVTKQATSWTGLYLFIGIIAGFAIGVVLDSMVMGLGIGVFIGVSIGAAFDHSETLKLTEVTGEKTLSRRRRRKLFKKTSHVEDVEAAKEIPENDEETEDKKEA